MKTPDRKETIRALVRASLRGLANSAADMAVKYAGLRDGLGMLNHTATFGDMVQVCDRWGFELKPTLVFRPPEPKKRKPKKRNQ